MENHGKMEVKPLVSLSKIMFFFEWVNKLILWPSNCGEHWIFQGDSRWDCGGAQVEFLLVLKSSIKDGV